MQYVCTNRTARRCDEKAMESVSAETLMERAGEALAEAVNAAADRLGLWEILIVCGGGNNGGDGFVAARILRERKFEVSVLCLSEKFSEECARAKNAYTGELLSAIPARRYGLIVDCVLGTGLRRAPEGNAAALIGFINGSGAYVLSCDLPSGLSEGGVAAGVCVKANETLCIGSYKAALLLSDGADMAGKISVADIGIPAAPEAEVWEESDVKAYFPAKRSHSNKGNYGTASILAGSSSLGAPLMAAGAALKSGAGYTELWLQPSGSRETDALLSALLAAKYPACIIRFYGEKLPAGAVAFGMGAGVGEAQYALLGKLLKTETDETLVLDADALNALAEYGTAPLKEHSRPVIVTPHMKEFSRLTKKSVEEILSDPLNVASAFAREYGAVVVLKNNRTVISDGKRTAVNPTGSPALAKGGSGDALAGLIAGTCARGVPPFEAACAACYLFGKAGELAAEEMGEYAPTAEDVIARLPAVMPR